MSCIALLLAVVCFAVAFYAWGKRRRERLGADIDWKRFDER